MSYTVQRPSVLRYRRYSIGTSDPLGVTTRDCTLASSPSIRSPTYVMGSPAYCSILPMYALAMRPPKRRTNSFCSAGEAWVHALPRERCDISSKSKRVSVTLRIWARRSATEGALAAGLSGCEKTCCTAAFTVSVGLAAVAGLAAASTTAMMIVTIGSLPCRGFALVMRRAVSFQSLTPFNCLDTSRIQCRRPRVPGQNGRHDAQLDGGRGRGRHLAARARCRRGRAPARHAEA